MYTEQIAELRQQVAQQPHPVSLIVDATQSGRPSGMSPADLVLPGKRADNLKQIIVIANHNLITHFMEMLLNAFRRSGFHVQIVNSLQQALAVIAQHRQDAEHPDGAEQ